MKNRQAEMIKDMSPKELLYHLYLSQLAFALIGVVLAVILFDDLASFPKIWEWQTFDITLIGRRVTVVLNGRTIIADRVIPGITGGALDSNEGEPGPILLQGDHGPVEFRRIVITPARYAAN